MLTHDWIDHLDGLPAWDDDAALTPAQRAVRDALLRAADAMGAAPTAGDAAPDGVTPAAAPGRLPA